MQNLSERRDRSPRQILRPEQSHVLRVQALRRTSLARPDLRGGATLGLAVLARESQPAVSVVEQTDHLVNLTRCSRACGSKRIWLEGVNRTQGKTPRWTK
jgi:UDP-N-acetylglucosamine enolpyruvyl transferase